MPAKMCKKRRRGLQRVRRENFLKGRKNKGNSIILFFLFNFFSLFYFFFCVYVGGKKKKKEGGDFSSSTFRTAPFFFASHGRPFRFVVRLFEGKRRRRKASFIFQGLEGNLKRWRRGVGFTFFFFLKEEWRRTFLFKLWRGKRVRYFADEKSRDLGRLL